MRIPDAHRDAESAISHNAKYPSAGCGARTSEAFTRRFRKASHIPMTGLSLSSCRFGKEPQDGKEKHIQRPLLLHNSKGKDVSPDSRSGWDK